MGLLVVVVLLLAGSMAGCLGGEDENGNGNGNGDEEVLANAGNNVIGKVGEAVTFNASLSSGPIKKYWWDVDMGNASTPLTEDLVGQEVSYTYMAAGKYIVTLTVEGESDKNSTDTVTVFIDMVQETTGTLSATKRNVTSEYTVTEDVQAVKLKLTYASPTILNPYIFDMEVYTDGTQPIATTLTQPPDQGDTQTEELDLTVTQLTAHGGFRLVVHWTTAPTSDVNFDLKVEILYSAA